MIMISIGQRRACSSVLRFAFTLNASVTDSEAQALMVVMIFQEILVVTKCPAPQMILFEVELGQIRYTAGILSSLLKLKDWY